MAAVNRWIFLVAGLAVAMSGCSLAPDKQWYKPGVSYTVADFQRDHAACTKSRQLDEPCMKARGWISLSGDVPPKSKTLEEQERERRGSTGGSTPITPSRY